MADKIGNNPAIPVQFGMSTDLLSAMVTELGQQNGAISSNEAIEVHGVEVSGAMTVVDGEIIERTMN